MEKVIKVWGGRRQRLTQRRWNLAQLARMTSVINGDTAEFGVAKGASSRLIVEVTQMANTRKKHWMFDSFEGLPAPKPKDTSSEAPIFWTEGMLAHPQHEAENMLEGFNVEIVKGFLPDSLLQAPFGNLSFAHIDLDLEQGTEEVLNYCWERLTPGGLIVVDDYGSVSCPGVTEAVDSFSKKRGAMFGHLSSGQALFQKNETH